MVTINQIQAGFTRFVDSNLSTMFDGWQKAIVLTGSVLLARNLPKVAAQYVQHPIIAALGIYDPQADTYDIDGLCGALADKIGAEKIPVTIPGIGIIKLGKSDIETLARYIKEA